MRATFSSGSRQDTKPPWTLPPAFLAPRRCWSLPDGVRETLSSFQDAATERHATAQSMLVGSALDWIKGHHQSTKSPCKAPSLLVILACVSYQCMFPFRFACARFSLCNSVNKWKKEPRKPRTFQVFALCLCCVCLCVRERELAGCQERPEIADN